jgi:hypothetical protein
MSIVTRATLMDLLKDEKKRPHVIGRALVALFEHQTRTEQAANHTQVHNYVGFSSSDARDGSITAKYYLKHKTLLPWQIDNWMKDFRGFPRITKYVRQLNAAAEAKAAARRPAIIPMDPDRGY